LILGASGIILEEVSFDMSKEVKSEKNACFSFGGSSFVFDG
jgi:hypothetical protein